MKNFELRYLERKTGKTLMNEHGFYYDETVKVLQSRHTLTVTDYSFRLPDDNYTVKKVWTEWTDVPVVEED